MYFRIKISRTENDKQVKETYLTDALHFADAGYKIISLLGNTIEVEEVKLMKNFKPAINEKYSEDNKLYMVKIAEDTTSLDSDKIKTIKYDLPVFANDSNDLYKIVNDYLKQGLNDMRLTTTSETQWIYID